MNFVQEVLIHIQWHQHLKFYQKFVKVEVISQE